MLRRGGGAEAAAGAGTVASVEEAARQVAKEEEAKAEALALATAWREQETARQVAEKAARTAIRKPRHGVRVGGHTRRGRRLVLLFGGVQPDATSRRGVREPSQVTQTYVRSAVYMYFGFEFERWGAVWRVRAERGASERVVRSRVLGVTRARELSSEQLTVGAQVNDLNTLSREVSSPSG